MNKFKINLYSNDSLLPSTSDKNESKYTQWVYDGSGDVSLYVNQRSLDILQDVSNTPKYIWLLESKQIIQGVYDWILANYEFVESRVDGILSCDRELCEKYPKFQYALSNAAPWVVDRQIFEKTQLVSMISSNKSMVPGHRKRLEFVNKFKDQVHLYGRGFRDLDAKEDGLRDYMFSIAVENAVYDTYFTEKLTDCFATGTIPVFYGCKGVTEYFNEDGIVFLNDDFDFSTLTKELYYFKMEAIKDNFERANNLPVAEDYLYETYWK
jgi:hypothetical protein